MLGLLKDHLEGVTVNDQVVVCNECARDIAYGKCDGSNASAALASQGNWYPAGQIEYPVDPCDGCGDEIEDAATMFITEPLQTNNLF